MISRVSRENQSTEPVIGICFLSVGKATSRVAMGRGIQHERAEDWTLVLLAMALRLG